MKLIWIFLTAITISGVSRAECTGVDEAASSFMNAYKNHEDDLYNRKTKETTEHWLQRNENITENFKKTYKKLVDEANKADPELGLDFDPIFAAQDYPDKGFEIIICEKESEKSHYVTLKGRDWADFRVAVKIVNTKSGWLVDGAGVINIPKNRQAK